MNSENISNEEQTNKIKKKVGFDNLKSNVILKKILNFMKQNKSLEIMKISKKMQNRLNLNIKDYINYNHYSLYLSPIEIEIEVSDKIGKNLWLEIDLHDYILKKDYHIYIGNSKKEEESHFIDFLGNYEKIKIIIEHQVKSLKDLFYNQTYFGSIIFKTFSRIDIDDMSCMFHGCRKLEKLDISKLKTNNVRNMSGMFEGCSSLKELDLSKFDTRNANNMSRIFSGCSSLKELNLSKFDTYNATNMSKMFSRCSSLKELNLSKFDTRNVNNMSGIFEDCSSLTDLNITNFKTHNVIDMSEMFSGCSSIKELNLECFFTYNAKKMDGMFYDCSSLKDLNIINFSTDNVKDMSSMFCRCTSLKYLNIKHFDTSKVRDMSWMFKLSGIENLDISNFNTLNVSNIYCMFNGCSSLKELNISNFNIKDTNYMFDGCSNELKEKIKSQIKGINI